MRPRLLVHHLFKLKLNQMSKLFLALLFVVSSSSTTADPDSTSNKAAIKLAKDKFIVYCFLRSSDPHRYGTLLTILSNQYLIGNDQYPADLTQAYGMMVNYKIDKTTKHKPSNSVPTNLSDNDSEDADEVEEDMTFLQHSKPHSNVKDNKETREQYSQSTSNFQEAIHLYMDAPTSLVDGTSLDTTDFTIDF